MNAIYNMITIDNINFLNLASNLTKLYIDYRPIEKLTLHWDCRIFWKAMQGREEIFDNEAAHNGDEVWWANENEYKDWYNKHGRPNTLDIEKKAMLKANISISYSINDKINLTIGAKNIFSDPQSSSDFMKRNSLRWQLMVAHGDQDLYTSDVRSVFGKLEVTF